MRGEWNSNGLFRFGVFTQPGSQAEGREFRTKGSFPFRSGGAHVRFKGPDGWATAVSGAAAQDLPDMLAVRPALWKGMRMCCFYICGGTGLVIAASDIFSVGVDAGPICSTKRHRQALAANGSLKYCVSWATLPSLNSIMLTV